MTPVGQRSRLLRRDGRAFFPVGVHLVPAEGPDWPWRVGPAAFERAFAAIAAAGLDTVRIDLLWDALEPAPGRYDEAHLATLDAILAAARRHGLLLHPTLFVGGEVGDAWWDVAWRAGRHPHADPEMRRLATAHARALATRWRGDDAILAWDLSDEPPAWIAGDTADDDARAWTAALCEALRSADPGHPITIGTASQEVGWGPFRSDVVGELLDFTTVHPYPIYSPDLYPDGLLGARMTHAAAFETALAAGAGRPVMVHEYGASSAQFEPERIAVYDRLLAWSALGRGAIGALAWCWTDAEAAAHRRAPYVRQPHETEFGITDREGRLRPRGQVLADLAATVRGLDLDGLAGAGPVTSAGLIVPHEYVRPYDRAAFGLDGAAAGRYEPAERTWRPRRDPLPLVRGWLNGYVLAARAGLSVAFPRERLSDDWPEVPLVLLPAPLASASNTLHHVRTSFWRGAEAFFARGGSAWLSCSADVAIPEMAAVAGCRIADRAPIARPPVLRFVRPWGPFVTGEELALPPSDGTLATRSVRLQAGDAETIALDADGDPALVVARRGRGLAVTCAHPVELLLAAAPDAHGPTDRSWGLYAGLASAAGVTELAGVDHPDVTTGIVRGATGGLAAVTNHGPAALRVPLRLPDGVARVRVFEPGGARPLALEGASVELPLDPYGVTLVGWADPGQRGSQRD